MLSVYQGKSKVFAWLRQEGSGGDVSGLAKSLFRYS